MPESFDVAPIIITGTLLGGAANPNMLMWMMMDRAAQSPRQVVIVEPAVGTVDGHTIVVKWGEARPPLKPELAQTQIESLRDAYIRTGQVVKGLSDTATYLLGKQVLTGAQVKSAYFALREIRLTDDIYGNGYGGANHGTILYIGQGASSGWGKHGDAGYDFIMLHEAVHNSVPGRAIVQQNFDRHLKDVANGSYSGKYDGASPHFITQESMTNLLTKQLADQIGVNVDSPGSTGYPTFGYYSGTELNP